MQYKYLFLLEDDTAPKCVLDRVLDTLVQVPIKELFAVTLDFCKHICELTTVKHVAHASANVIQVNELAGLDSKSVTRKYGNQVLQNNDGLIVSHHSLPLRSLETKLCNLGHTIRGVLDSSSEIITMPKCVWEDLGLLIRSDHTMNMSSANTSINTTVSILENLALDFGRGEVLVQVQVLAWANFNLLLG